MVMGPSLKVDLHTGAIAEGVLTFVITFLVLCIILRGPQNALLKNWLLAMTTVVIVFAGAGYTGPSMNPAIVRTKRYFLFYVQNVDIFSSNILRTRDIMFLVFYGNQYDISV